MRNRYHVAVLPSSASSPVSSYTYQRGATGTLSNVAEQTGRTANWNYDGIYRLTTETIASDPSGNNGSVGYGLDPVGNRTSQSSSISGVPSISSMNFSADDLLSAESYDANGNTTATGGQTYAYDSENHLVSMNSGAVTLVYDGDGNRVAKTVGGVTRQYLVDDLNPTGYPQVMDELVGGAVQRTYTYGLQRISEEQVVSGAWTTNFYGYDGGGSVRQLTNTSGVVTDTYNYDAFGNELNHTGSTPNNFLYRGEQYDSDLSLYYLRARYMNPLTGRFLSRDPKEYTPLKWTGSPLNSTGNPPLDPMKLHKYLYAGGDPVNMADPRGRASILETGSLDVTIGEGPLPALREFGVNAFEILCSRVKFIPSTGSGPDMNYLVITKALLGGLCSAFGM